MNPGSTCIFLLQLLHLVSQLLQLGPDVRGDVGPAVIRGCFCAPTLKQNLCILVLSICLSPRPLQTEQQRQNNCSSSHHELSTA